MTENNQFEQINDYFHHLKGTDYSPLYFPHFSKLIATMIKHMFIIIFSGIVLMDTDLACECNGIVLGESLMAVKKDYKISQVVMVITRKILNLLRVAGGHE